MSKIELTHIDKYYGKNHVLKDLNLTIEDGVFRATVIMRLGSASDAAARGEAERTLPDRAACADDLELAGGVL